LQLQPALLCSAGENPDRTMRAPRGFFRSFQCRRPPAVVLNRHEDGQLFGGRFEEVRESTCPPIDLKIPPGVVCKKMSERKGPEMNRDGGARSGQQSLPGLVFYAARPPAGP